MRRLHSKLAKASICALLLGSIWLLFVKLSLAKREVVRDTNWRQSDAYPDELPWSAPKSRKVDLKVIVVEEHQEVMPHWVDIVKRMNYQKAKLIHIDAHSDMDFPEVIDDLPMGRFPKNDREISAMMQSNDRFIQSAIIGQLVDQVQLIFPSWQKMKHLYDQYALGLYGEGMDRFICMCSLTDKDDCLIRGEQDYNENMTIDEDECDKRWNFEFEEVDTDDFLHSFKQTVPKNYYPETELYRKPLILDIDEDYFSVHLPMRNLTQIGWNMIVVEEVDNLIRSIFCSTEPGHEKSIDLWFRSLLDEIMMNCQYNTSHVAFDSWSEVTKCRMRISDYIDSTVVTPHPDWICPNLVHRDLDRLIEILSHPTLNRTHLTILGRIGVCNNEAWSSHKSEHHLRLCVGYNSPGLSIVEEFTPTRGQFEIIQSQMYKIVAGLPTRPALITICRSTRDGYTARWLQPIIEQWLLRIIKSTFQLQDEDISFSSQLAGGMNGWHLRY